MLPTELSKTSQPMAWNQPAKKVLPARAQEMNFVKPTHGDIKPTQEDSVCILRSDFDLRHPVHHTLDTEAAKCLQLKVQASISHTGLSQFWGQNLQVANPTGNSGSALKLWSLVIFSHENAATVSPDMFYKPTAAQCYESKWQPVDRLKVPSGVLFIMGG